MSSSDPESYSDSSSGAGSSPYKLLDSPYGSPSQQVPHLTHCLKVLSCSEDALHADTSGFVMSSPYLQVMQEPQDYFRFRYKSEMVGTHGCLTGRSPAIQRIKTHPTVKLFNYKGKAVIKCKLSQVNNGDDHPHKLLEDDQDRDVYAEVGPEKGYEVRFSGMGIIHTPKKDVSSMLFKKYSQAFGNKPFNAQALRTKCEGEANTINLNIVRLKFSAHDIDTDMEICPPVFSEPIHNMKSAATNDLKICRIDKVSASPNGGEDVFILVEKVNKKNIDVRFVELGPNGDIIWSDKGRFTQNDVHHQYAIVFRTPPYKNPQTTHDVKVYVELYRPSDGRTSERIDFTYVADRTIKGRKRKAVAYPSMNSSSGSIGSYSDLPIPVVSQASTVPPREEFLQNLVQNVSYMPSSSSTEPLADALFSNTLIDPIMMNVMPQLLPQPPVQQPPPVQMTSTERDLDKMLVDSNLASGDIREFLETFDSSTFREAYSKEGNNPQQEEDNSDINNSFSLFKSSLNMVTDSGGKIMKSPHKNDTKPELKVTPDEDNYSKEDDLEIKKLVKELCEVVRDKSGKLLDVKRKLEDLFELRLNNGDTFLHMAICSQHQQNIDNIVKIINETKMEHLLNLTNAKLQTILHLAIVHELPKYVRLFVLKGCNPMIQDIEGNNAIHYAIKYDSCLGELLAAIKESNVDCNLNALNDDNQTALHLAVVKGLPHSCEQLLKWRANPSIRGPLGRTALHLAVYDHHVDVLKVLLKHISEKNIDMTDGRSTALQIVCGAPLHNNSCTIVKMLLEKGADPIQSEEGTASAWKLSSDKSELKEIIRTFLLPYFVDDDDNHSESEDEEEEEDEDCSNDLTFVEDLHDMPLYLNELAMMLDRSGHWRELAERLKCDSLLNWFEKTESPTTTLLNQFKEIKENFSSQSLAMLLNDMGQTEAAHIIIKTTAGKKT